MKRSRFTEQRIVEILKAAEGGTAVREEIVDYSAHGKAIRQSRVASIQD